jgi:ABC-2 type transport system permease protein
MIALTRPAPRAGWHARATGKLLASEARLLLRDPGSLFTILIPVFLLGAFGVTAGSAATAVVPTMLTVAMGMSGLYLVPTTLAGYREKGILRRLSTTPLPPARLLIAQLLLQAALAAISVTLLIGIAVALLRAAAPADLPGLAAVLVVGGAAMLACGLLIGATARDGRSANGIGVLLFFPLAYLAGMLQPPALMPSLLRAIGEFTPLGALRVAIEAAWSGASIELLPIGILAAYAVGIGLAAAKLFRWG